LVVLTIKRMYLNFIIYNSYCEVIFQNLSGWTKVDQGRHVKTLSNPSEIKARHHQNTS
jgi:hypothetical protein